MLKIGLDKMNETLKLIENFHGHLGPYAVLGYRMGLIANEKLGNDAFCKSAIVMTGNKPPISCIVDGIQLSSGCTLGKGNINVENQGIAKAIFSNKEGEKIIIRLKDEIKNDIDKNVTEENMINYTINLYSKADSQLFELD
jgi:formylmethanofuran dehydrogenase subunit E